MSLNLARRRRLDETRRTLIVSCRTVSNSVGAGLPDAPAFADAVSVVDQNAGGVGWASPTDLTEGRGALGGGAGGRTKFELVRMPSTDCQTLRRPCPVPAHLATLRISRLECIGSSKAMRMESEAQGGKERVAGRLGGFGEYQEIPGEAQIAQAPHSS